MVHFDHLKCSMWFWKIPSIQNPMSTGSQRLSADISYGFENINHKNMYEKYLKFVELENLIKWYSRSHNGDVDDTNFFFLFFLEWRSLFLLLKLNQTRSSAVHKLILFDLIFLPTPSIPTSTSAATTAAAAATAAPTLITERSYWCSRLSETCS